MNIQECHDFFDVLVDKEADPYFTRENKDLYINMAHIEYLKRILPSNEGGTVNIEDTQLVFNNIYPLVYEVSGLAMNSSGVIPVATVQTSLNTASSMTDPFMYIMNVNVAGYPALYTRHNDWYVFEKNSLKKGSTVQPRYRHNQVNFVFSPVSTTSTVGMTLLKTPRAVDFQNSIDSELPTHTHKTIVEIAVELASVSLREGDLTQINSIQENK